MSLTSPLSPGSFADLDDAPPAEIGLLVERAAAEAEAGTLKRATALLLDRALRLLRAGSRQEILEEALAVSRGISGEAGRALHDTNPETFGAWASLHELLTEAGRRSDRAAVPSLLRSTQGHGLAILELLAAEGRALPRAEVRRRLNLGEAHLSHLLRDLEEADLIVRYRSQGSKEVLVELGPAGREVVSQSVLPPWLERLVGALGEIAAGSPLEAESLARELEEAGAPSRLAAERIAEVVSTLVMRTSTQTEVAAILIRNAAHALELAGQARESMESVFARASASHRRQLIRDQILNFAVLYTLRPDGQNHGYILRRQGRFFLCDPAAFASDYGIDPDALAFLGTTLMEATENLPNALGAERVKYMRYQQILRAVREGLAPRVLSEIVLLPFNWRNSAEELRRLLDRPLPGSLEEKMLDDYETSHRVLHQALEDRLESLRRIRVEQETLGAEAEGNFAGLDSETARQNLAQSISILELFSKQWRQMEKPDESGTLPEAFKVLFTPLKPREEDEFSNQLNRLHKSFGV